MSLPEQPTQAPGGFLHEELPRPQDPLLVLDLSREITPEEARAFMERLGADLDQRRRNEGVIRRAVESGFSGVVWHV